MVKLKTIFKIKKYFFTTYINLNGKIQLIEKLYLYDISNGMKDEGKKDRYAVFGW